MEGMGTILKGDLLELPPLSRSWLLIPMGGWCAERTMGTRGGVKTWNGMGGLELKKMVPGYVKT